MESPGHRFLDSWVCLLQLAKGSIPLVSNPGRNPQVEVTKVDTNTNIASVESMDMFGLNCVNHVSHMFLYVSPGVPGDTWAYGIRMHTGFPDCQAHEKGKTKKNHSAKW